MVGRTFSALSSTASSAKCPRRPSARRPSRSRKARRCGFAGTPPSLTGDRTNSPTPTTPLDLAVGTLLTEENSGPGGGFAHLDEAGNPLAEIGEEWSARMPTSPESVSLQLPGGTPVIDLTRPVYDSKGHAAEVMQSSPTCNP